MIFDTKQISEKPPRYEATLNLHFYPNLGWYRVSVVGFGDCATSAEAAAQTLFDQARLAMAAVGHDGRSSDHAA